MVIRQSIPPFLKIFTSMLKKKICPNRIDTRFLLIISKDVRFRKFSGVARTFGAHGTDSPGPLPILHNLGFDQARSRGAWQPLPKKKKKRGEKGKGKKKKRGKRKRNIKKLSRHNLFFCAYRPIIGLHWPMGVGVGGSRPNKRRGNIRKYAVFMHQKL